MQCAARALNAGARNDIRNALARPLRFTALFEENRKDLNVNNCTVLMGPMKPSREAPAASAAIVSGPTAGGAANAATPHLEIACGGIQQTSVTLQRASVAHTRL